MGYKVFVDTDVIIDFLVDRQPHAVASSKIFDLCDLGIIEINTSTLCINNVHYIISKVVGDVKAREILSELMELIEVLGVGKPDILNALKSKFKDFEDAVQHSVAMCAEDIKSIITRNTKDYRKAEISVFSPDAFIRMIENEQH
jgi:predicted nucleic acid-binding protein